MAARRRLSAALTRLCEYTASVARHLGPHTKHIGWPSDPIGPYITLSVRVLVSRRHQTGVLGDFTRKWPTHTRKIAQLASAHPVACMTTS